MNKPKPKCMTDCVARGTAICHSNDCPDWKDYQEKCKAYKALVKGNKQATRPDAIEQYINERNRRKKND